MTRRLKQAWWAPLAGLLVLGQLAVTLGFVFGEGTSNLLDWESTFAGVTLTLAGAAVLLAGLWIRPQASWPGSVLIIVGAVLAAVWFWTILLTPIAIIVIVGVVVSQVRPPSPAAESP